MKLAVVGAGAMAGALAAEAALGGYDVHVVDVSSELVEKIATDGIEIRSGNSTEVGRPRATTDAATVGIADVIVLFVKAQHTRPAAEAVKLMQGSRTVVLSLQNGWGNADVLAEVLGTERLVFGVTYHSCSVVGLGIVHHSGRGDTFIGAFEGDDQTAAEKAAALLNSIGWSTTVSPTVRTDIWKKLVLNCATLPTAALTGLNAGALGASREMWPAVESIARETVTVAVALGLQIDADERVNRIRATLSAAGTGKPSMLQDAEAHRKTEIEVINAAVARAGASVGTPTPLNELMVAMMTGLESGWTRP